MRDGFIDQLADLACVNRDVVLVTGDLGFGVFDSFRARFPAQFINAGIAEQNMTALATGLAMNGKVVFTYSIGNFSTLRCLEQIRNDVCYHNANVKVVSVGGGFSYGALGISHHATEDIAILRSLPNLTIVAPTGLWETREATAAIAAHEGACYLRLDKSFGDDHPQHNENFVLGRARVLRDGSDITLIVAGGILEEVQSAADLLSSSGIRARVVSMHTIKPLDVEAIVCAARDTGGIVTVEEHTIHGGLGGAVAECLMDHGARPRRFERIALMAGFSSEVGSQRYLRSRYEMDAVHISARVRALLSRSEARTH